MKIKLLFISLVYLFISSINATDVEIQEYSLEQTISQLDISFKEYEQTSPAKGYQVNIIFEKNTGKYQGFFYGCGERMFGTPIEMLNVKTCLYCLRHDCCFFHDLDLNQFLADHHLRIFHGGHGQIAIVPQWHLPHWFDGKHLEKDQFTHLQISLVKAATLVCQFIEKHFPQKLSTDDTYHFQMNCGVAAGQNIPHLHLKIISGPNEGSISREEWENITFRFWQKEYVSSGNMD